VSNLTHVKGLGDLQALLDTLPAKIEQNILRGALRAGSKPIVADAKMNAPKLSGEMAAGIKVSTKAKAGQVTVSIRVKGKHGYLAHWMEYGTKPHKIAGKDGRPLVINGQMIGSVEHPGVNPRPFMRPALDNQANAALVATGNYIKDRLANKHGLDTADILLEGDE
jgi:HK97 gp10 family phage protein